MIYRFHHSFINIINLFIDSIMLKELTTLPKVPLSIPKEFYCFLSKDIMREPVVIASGRTYEKNNIRQFFNGRQYSLPEFLKCLNEGQSCLDLTVDRYGNIAHGLNMLCLMIKYIETSL